MSDHPQAPEELRFDRRVFRLAVAGSLLAGCFTILRPFLGAAIWSVILAVSAWPGFIRLRKRFGNRPRIAAWLCCLLGVLLLLLPLVLAGLSVARGFPAGMRLVARLTQNGLPQPPAFLDRIPLAGSAIHSLWSSASEGEATIIAQYGGALRGGAFGLIGRAGTFGLTVLQFALALLLATLLLGHADAVLRLLRAFARRVGGERGPEILTLAEHTIRAVSFGVLGTALAEGGLSAAGFALAGMSPAMLLGAGTFLCCLMQLGPGLVFLPAAAWAWWHGSLGRAIFLVLWHLALVLPIEVLGRPFFISRGTGLPLMLILFGVIGGLLAFGFIGIFIGATILAVSWTVLLRWLQPPEPSA